MIADRPGLPPQSPGRFKGDQVSNAVTLRPMLATAASSCACIGSAHDEYDLIYVDYARLKQLLQDHLSAPYRLQ
jgi:hypothetical protein